MNSWLFLLLASPLLFVAGYRFRIVRLLGYVLILTALLAMGIAGLVDKISLFFSAVALSVAVPVGLYAEEYVSEKLLPRNFVLLIDLFSWCIAATFVAPNILTLAVLWTVAELIGFALISMGSEDTRYSRAAGRFLLVSVLTFELSVFTLVFTSMFVMAATVAGGQEVWRSLTAEFSELASIRSVAPAWAVPLLVIGFVTKMALVPLHFWLPDAHSIAPAPASAILSGVMTSMGLYALLRVWETVSLSAPVFTGMLVIQGFLSVVYASLMAAAQTNIKRILAYSTIMHCGVMALLAALLPYSGAAVKILALYALFHGISKAQLFVNTGSVYILTNTIDVHRLGYLARTNPELYRATILGASSFMALPPTLGFAVKALLIYVAFEVMSRGGIYSLLFLLAVAISSVFGIVYVVKYIGIYVGSLKEPRRPTIRLPSTLVFAEQVLGWSVVALVPLVMTIMVNWFVNLLMLIYLVSAALLIYSLYIKAPRVVPFDDVWLGGVAP